MDEDENELAALRVLERLVADDGIEFVSSHGLSVLGPVVARLLERTTPGPERSAALAGWLIDHREVRDLYVDDEALEAVLAELWDTRRQRAGRAPITARRDDLERLLVREPDNLEHQLVYGDWLQASQDPFGELITRKVAAALAPDDARLAAAADEYLREHGSALFGPLHEYLGVVVHLDWSGGFIAGARLGKHRDDPGPYEGAILLRWLLEHRAALLLRSLELHSFDDHWARDQYRELLAVVLERPRPQLRELIVAHHESAGEAGELHDLAERLPALEVLELRVRSVSVPELAHSRLRRLVWHGLFGPKQARAFERAALPRLEELGFGPQYLPPAIETALAEAELPALRTLRLRGTGERVVGIARASYRDGLEILDLSGGSLEDRDAMFLASQRWAKLRRLDVSNNRLGPAGIAALAGLGVELIAAEQRPTSNDEHDFDEDEDDDDDDDGVYDSVRE